MFIEKEQFDPTDLLAYMKTKMPSYMIPTRVFWVPVFQLNANGKIDKNILKSMI
jgi:acyl-CoA synthetase (AMP-forming)/AMP-acid ligase II